MYLMRMLMLGAAIVVELEHAVVMGVATLLLIALLLGGCLTINVDREMLGEVQGEGDITAFIQAQATFTAEAVYTFEKQSKLNSQVIGGLNIINKRVVKLEAERGVAK